MKAYQLFVRNVPLGSPEIKTGSPPTLGVAFFDQ